MDPTDRDYLEQAMDLAEQARGDTSPNPVVGAVIVGGDEVLGVGYHRGPGQDHAEVAAIKDAVRRLGNPGSDRPLQGTTMYVSLEPCCTYGRTPPCTEALVAAGFTRVVVGAIDPSPKVKGRGIEQLREGGIQVDVADGALAHRAKRQNNGMRKAVQTGLPFVTYKYALTLDGRVATDVGDSRWISNEDSRALVHRWRGWSDAVLIGAGTMRADDPRLTSRDRGAHRQPLRVVVDSTLSIPHESALVRTVTEGSVLAVCVSGVSASRRAEVESWGVETLEVVGGPDGRPDPREAGRALVQRGIQEVLLEGGPRLAAAWWSAGMIDKVAAFVCPRVAGGEENRGALAGPGCVRMEDSVVLREVEVWALGFDLLVTGYRGDAF